MRHVLTGRGRYLLAAIAMSCVLASDPGGAGASALLEVTPNSAVVFASAGSAGGPFSPSSVTFTVTNRGTAEALSWCAAKSQPWLLLSISCGTLAAGRSATLTASIDQAAAATLPADGYSDPIVFSNLTNGTVLTAGGSVLAGVTRRFMTLNIRGSEDSAVQGFGAGTRGGTGGTVFRVTTLEDNGNDAAPVPGSLRDAVSRRNRYVVFDVAGTIALQTHLWIQADHITIDGTSAPPPGITLTHYGIILRGNRGAHDVVLRALRVRDLNRFQGSDTQWDGIQVASGAFNILIDGVSVHGADDGSIDITESHDVTVAWSIVGPSKSGKNVLIKYHPYRISFHHNLLANSPIRNPQVENDDPRAPIEISADIRNNLLWKFGTGTVVAKGAWANVVNNYYTKSAIKLQSPGRAYTRGNLVHNSRVDMNRVGREGIPFPAAPVDTTDAFTAACQVLARAGVRPLDAIDQGILAPIVLSGCAGRVAQP